MISVVIPTYNRAQYLIQAIDSVLSQTVQGLEIIVIDDASTDNTKEILKKYIEQNKIKYIYQNDKERAAARNLGILNSKGEYIAFLDSDDLWDKEHLENCLYALKKNPKAGVSFAGSYLIDENNNIISKIKLSAYNGNVLKKIVTNYSSGGCNASSCLIKKEIFNKAGLFNEQRILSGSEDWEMWVRLAANTHFISTKNYTAKVRIHSGQTSINVEGMAKSMKLSLDIVYENEELLPLIAKFKNQAYSSLYIVIAINYYANGDGIIARKYLKEAIIEYPLALFTNKYFVLTFLRSLLGSKISLLIRKIKWRLTGYLRSNSKN